MNTHTHTYSHPHIHTHTHIHTVTRIHTHTHPTHSHIQAFPTEYQIIARWISVDTNNVGLEVYCRFGSMILSVHRIHLSKVQCIDTGWGCIIVCHDAFVTYCFSVHWLCAQWSIWRSSSCVSRRLCSWCFGSHVLYV